MKEPTPKRGEIWREKRRQYNLRTVEIRSVLKLRSGTLVVRYRTHTDTTGAPAAHPVNRSLPVDKFTAIFHLEPT